jgi:hypothetical protein
MVSSKNPTPPERGGQVQHWSYEPVVHKSQQRGWIAGKPFGAWQHYANRKSHVCREKMSDKALQCERCMSGLIPEWRGFVPWYDTEYTRRFSLITFAYFESVSEIPHLSMIVLRRGEKKTDPVVIRAEQWDKKPLPYSAERFEPVDLGPFLVKVLWKDAALLEWDKNQQRAIPGVANPDQAAIDYADPDLKKLARLQKAEDKHVKQVELDEMQIGNTMNRLLRPAPGANGKYHAPKK